MSNASVDNEQFDDDRVVDAIHTLTAEIMEVVRREEDVGVALSALTTVLATVINFVGISHQTAAAAFIKALRVTQHHSTTNTAH